MAKKLFKNKNVAFKRRGDKLIVKLIDFNWNIVYEKEVNINDREGLKSVMLDLRNYGVDLTKVSSDSWFD